MKLVQDDTNLFEWRNPAWKDGPGTFAVVLGVSAYAHVQEGSGARASKTYGLRQLPGSVLTAFKFFEWLETAYRSSTAPLARCYLALSPSEDERRTLPRIARVPEATFNNCSDALTLWRRTMEQLDAGHAAQSRCLFFFSGHGFEVHHDKQLLLPSDYLRPPAENVNQAISTENIYLGLRELGVPEQFLFLDACRSDHEDLRSRNVKGAQIFLEGPAAFTHGKLVQPVFYPCGPGQSAYSPPDGKLSVFGQALLDGLLARAGLQVFSENGKGQVRVFNLAAFLHHRVGEILAEYGGREEMSVGVGSIVKDACVTEVPIRRQSPPRPLYFAGVYSADVELIEEGDLNFFKGIPPLVRGHGFDRNEGRWAPVKDGRPLPRKLKELWSRIQVLDVETGVPVDARSVVVSKYQVRSPDRRYFLRLRVSGQSRGRALWLQANEGALASACVIPAENDPAEFTSFVLEVRVHSRTGAIEHLSLEVDTFDNVSTLKLAAVLWRLFRSGQLALAVEPALMGRLEHVLQEKRATTLGATIAGAILLRLGSFEFLHDWLRNLSEWFPSIPDGPVLWMEHLQRDPKWRDVKVLAEALEGRSLEEELVRQLTRVAERGLPYSVESFSFLASLLERFKRAPVAGMPSELVPELSAQVDRALRYFRSDGVSLVFQGPADELSPALIRPLKARR